MRPARADARDDSPTHPSFLRCSAANYFGTRGACELCVRPLSERLRAGTGVPTPYAALREPYQGSSGILFKVYIWHCELIFIQFRRFRKTKSQKIASLAPLALRSLVFEPHLCWIQPVRLYAVAVYGFYGSV